MKHILKRAQDLQGQTLYELACALKMALPSDPRHAKGWMGQLLEKALGCEAGSRAGPDFPEHRLELKTIPISRDHRVQESTYITTCPLNVQSLQKPWEETPLAQKLENILWIPLIDTQLGPLSRQVGLAFIWQLSGPHADQLRQDWQAIHDLLAHSGIEYLSSSLGKFLQIRPKAAHGKKLQACTNTAGEAAQTLPRGFYLRSRFTQLLYNEALANTHRN